jgi:hypothetical protein
VETRFFEKKYEGWKLWIKKKITRNGNSKLKKKLQGMETLNFPH